MKKYPMYFSLCFMLIIMTSNQASGEYNYMLKYLLLGHTPNARAVALGKLGVTLDGEMTNNFYNPACIGTVEMIGVSASYSTPNYSYDEANYSYLGVAYQFARDIVIGLSRYHHSYGEKWNIYESGPEASNRFIPTQSLCTFTMAVNAWKDLILGINVNLVNYELPRGFGNDIDKNNAFLLDFGLLKKLTFNLSKTFPQSIGFAASLTNFTNSKIEDDYEEYELPMMFRTGASYEFSYARGNTLLFNTIAQIGYDDMLNSEFYGGFKYGVEITLLEVFSYRSGHYTEKVDNSNWKGGKLN